MVVAAHTFADPSAHPGGIKAGINHQMRAAYQDPVWIRFLTGEAAEHQDTGRIIGEATRRNAVARSANGELPADLPADLQQLAIYALAL